MIIDKLDKYGRQQSVWGSLDRGQDAHGIKVGDLLAECRVQNQRVINIKKG